MREIWGFRWRGEGVFTLEKFSVDLFDLLLMNSSFACEVRPY
jgi:hypothetical protein